MAIYSCNLKSIGRTTHAPGTAGAHIRYISRTDAEPVIQAAHMPTDPQEARNWLDRAERASRKNARVIDKIRLALPRELDEDQRAALVEEYMRDLCGGQRIPWYAAIHQSGKDAHNPHVHIAVHDRDQDSGKRILRLSDNVRDRLKAGLPGPKAVDWLRERWELVCNLALERGGHDIRVDRRTLEAQNIDREPTIHVGPRASHIDGHVQRPASKSRTNGCGRLIDYPAIDKGITRREFNARVIDLNLDRAARSKNPVAAAWAAFEKDQLAKDRALELRLAAEDRERTAQRRTTAVNYLAQIDRIRSERRLKQRQARQTIGEKFASTRESLREKQRHERDDLKARHGKLYLRIITMIDVTGTMRRRQEAARKVLSASHKEERHTLVEKYRSTKKATHEEINARYESQIERLQKKRAQHLTQLKEHHKQLESFGDLERQKREADRDHASKVVEKTIQDWRDTQKPADRDSHLAPDWNEVAARGTDPLAVAMRKAQRQEKDRVRPIDHGRQLKPGPH